MERVYLKPLAAALLMGLSTSVLASAGPVAAEEDTSAHHHDGEGISCSLLGNSAASGHAAKDWFDHVAFGGSAQVNVAYNDENTDSDSDYDTFLRLQNANFSALATLGGGWHALVNYAYVDNNVHSATDMAATTYGATESSMSEFDQAFVTYDGGKEHLTMLAGLNYGRFGEYEDPYTSLPSLSQGFEQFDAYVVDFGYHTPFGVVSVGAYEDEDQTSTDGDDRVKGFSFNYNVKRHVHEADVHFHASYINDYAQVLDADDVYGSLYWMRLPLYANTSSGTLNDYIGAVSSHVDVEMKDMHFGLSYDKVMDDLIDDDSDSEPSVFGIHAGMEHEFMGKDAHFDISFEDMHDGDSIFTADQRVALTAAVEVRPHVTTGVEWAVYDITDDAQDISSTELDDNSNTVLAFAKVVF